MPSTKNPVTGQAPANGTVSITNTDTSFASSSSPDLVALFQSSSVQTTVTAMGVTPASAASQLRWKSKRDPSDTVATGQPGLNTTTGAQVNITPSVAGNFRLICYHDGNANSDYDAGEEIRVLRFAVVRATLVTNLATTFIDSGGLSYAFASEPGEFAVISQSFPSLMLIQCRVLLEGGGSNRTIGISNLTFGVVGNLTLDTSKVNYGTSGMGVETPSQALPMVDCATNPNGGSTPFRSQLNVGMSNGPGGNGKHVTISSDDDPDVGPFKTAHAVVTWTSTQGGYDFREYIVGYPSSFPKYYVVFARGNWSVRVNGNNSGGTWVNNGSTLTLQGMSMFPQALTNLISSGSPQSGDAAGIQVLGLTFANILNRPIMYTP
jgi:hypothetical protein